MRFQSKILLKWNVFFELILPSQIWHPRWIETNVLFDYPQFQNVFLLETLEKKEIPFIAIAISFYSSDETFFRNWYKFLVKNIQVHTLPTMYSISDSSKKFFNLSYTQLKRQQCYRMNFIEWLHKQECFCRVSYFMKHPFIVTMLSMHPDSIWRDFGFSWFSL